MGKMFTFFLFCFLGVGILGSTMQGSVSISATELAAGITAADVTITVDSIEGYPEGTAPAEQRVIWIGNERIAYTAVATAPSPRFTGCTRGFGDTDAEAHDIDSRVYTSSASYINMAMDYNIATISDASGLWAAISIALALMRMFGLFFKLNFDFLGTDMAYLTYIWATLGIGALVSFGIALAGARRV